MPPTPLLDISRRWQRRLAVFLTALLIRLLYLYLIRDNPFFYSPIIDAQTYDEQAQQFARGLWPDDEPFWQPPLYSCLLGLLYTLFGRNLVLVRILQSVLGSLTCVLTSELAYRHYGHRAALVTGLLVAVYGPLVFIDGELLVPVVSLPLDLVTLLLLTPPGNTPLSRSRIAFAGLSVGLSAIARPTALLFGIAVLTWFLWQKSIETRRSRWGRAGVFGMLIAIPVAIVTLHNLRVGHEWILISSNGGVNFYLGNNSNYDQLVGIRPGIAWKTLMLQPGAHGALSPAAASAYWFHLGIQFLRSHPLDALLLQLKKILLLCQAYEIPRNLDYYFFSAHFAPLLGYLVQFGALFPLAVPSLSLSWRNRGQRHETISLLFLASSAASIAAFFVTGRYRLTLVPLLAVYAGRTVDLLLGALGERRLRYQLLAPVPLVALLIQADPFHVEHVDESEGFNLVGKALSNDDRHPEAVEAFLKALEINRNNADVSFNLGREYQIQQRCDLAIPFYEQAHAAFPQDRDTLNNLGVCELALGHAEKGVALLEEVASLYPDGVDVYFNLAQAHVAGFHFAEAKKALESGLRNDPLSQPLRGMLDHVERRLEEDTRLEAAWQAIATEIGNSEQANRQSREPQPVPEQVKALNNEGHRLLVQGNITSARARFAAALIQAPAYPTAWSNLGQCYYLSGQFDRARIAFERALRLNPHYWKASMGLGLTLAKGLKDPEQGRRILAQVSREAPEPERNQAEQLLQSLHD